ncbi:hypothetical protein BEWA_011580 [Theileria equi strain WA]|uniref:Uncharacterized protein n=1 Tax=Theileria equi strain WA TaxID=1537102 RepID=L0B1M9_THEEQ|nr:hypothetical protein BEWA_011580 [Theileria equi strain WA]AFZ81740.1 hypothetical protein BEWA_011580 [Theileria equi strain WA]|eukprot:XP_004831406.1 hypothetical protein BEWA_011580 [Theileria equi strain WA]
MNNTEIYHTELLENVVSKDDSDSNDVCFIRLLENLKDGCTLHSFPVTSSIDRFDNSINEEEEEENGLCELDEYSGNLNGSKKWENTDFTTYGLKKDQRKTAYFNRRHEPEYHYLKYFSRNKKLRTESLEIICDKIYGLELHNSNENIERSILDEALSNKSLGSKDRYCEEFQNNKICKNTWFSSLVSDLIEDSGNNASINSVSSEKPIKVSEPDETFQPLPTPNSDQFYLEIEGAVSNFEGPESSIKEDDGIMVEPPLPGPEDDLHIPKGSCNSKELVSHSKEMIIHMASSAMKGDQTDIKKHSDLNVPGSANNENNQVLSGTLIPNLETANKNIKSDVRNASSFHISSDHLNLAVGTTDGMIHLWSFLAREYTFEGLRINDTWCADPLIWRSLGSKPKLSVKAHLTDIISIYVNPVCEDGSEVSCIIASSGYDYHVKIWSFYKCQSRLDLISDFILEQIPINVSLLPRSYKIIVATQMGIVELWKLEVPGNMNETSSKRIKHTIKVENSVDTGKEITNASISERGKYYAIGTSNGLVILYDTNLALIGTYLCKNRRGYYANGRPVTGLCWNSGETIILVTTSDSRIRLLSTRSDENGKLPYLEKLKGHRNVTCKIGAKFFGREDEYILCPSESGHIYIWTNNQCGSFRSSISNKLSTTRYSERIRLPSGTLLSSIGLYNVEQWAHIMPTILKQEYKFKGDKTQPNGCLWSCKKMHNKGMDAKNSDPRDDVLLITVENGQELKYSILSLQCFEFEV